MLLFRNLWIVSLIVLSGCAYHAGTPRTSFKSIYIQPAKNKSLAPQFQALLTQQVVESFLQEGNFFIEESENADVSLGISISDYSRNMAASQSNDTALAQAMTLSISIKCTLTDNETGKIFFADREIASNVRVLVTDYCNEEYQAMNELARSLALKIKNSVISAW